MSSSIKEFQHLRISLQDLKSATNNFAKTNCIGGGGFGKVYEGVIRLSGVLTMVAIKRLDRSFGQGITEYWKEIMMLSQYKHENLVSLLGFCDEDGENLLVYEYLSNKSLDLYLDNVNLSWHQRLIICLEAAMGLQYLHEPVEGSQQRVLHRDIKSANILLDRKWRPKISDFGLAKLGPANQQFTFVFSNAVGTMGYIDPSYAQTGLLTKESDVYSFGVVLFEVLSGRPCVVPKYQDIRRSLAAFSRKCYEEKKMDTIIPIGLYDDISPKCLERFSAIAYQCVQLNHTERPTMSKVVEELEYALLHQSIHQSTIQEVALKEIQVATYNFKLYFGKNLFGDRIYEGELSILGILKRVVIRRFPEHSGPSLSDYSELIDLYSKLRHPNYVSALGYCYEKGEKIIVYEYGVSLDQYISSRLSDSSKTTSLTWLQRLEICVGAAHGLSYLHSKDMPVNSFKSASIFVDDKWVAKIGDLETLSTQSSTVFDRDADIDQAYNSPEYIVNGIKTQENNVYSFGIVLFEVLCGRLCTEKVDGYMLSAKRMKELYVTRKLVEFFDPALLREQRISSYSVSTYSSIAYRCLSDDPKERPSMDDVIKELEELLSLESIERSTIQEVSLKEIQVATNYFKFCIGKRKYGERMYEGELSVYGIPTRVVIRRFPEHPELTSSNHYLKVLDNFTEIHHPNYMSTLGYCNEEGEEIIVYEYLERGSLDQYIRRRSRNTTHLTWLQRLQICAGAARGLSYLHYKNRIEAGFKSAFILLDDKWAAKIGDLEIAKEGSTDLDRGIDDAYNSPEYIIDGIETQENNVYSFGIVLFEVLCGRLCSEEVDGYMLSAKLIKKLYLTKKLDWIVDPVLRKEKISSNSVNTYSTIAYRCLLDDPQERPDICDIALELKALLSTEVRSVEK